MAPKRLCESEGPGADPCVGRGPGGLSGGLQAPRGQGRSRASGEGGLLCERAKV